MAHSINQGSGQATVSSAGTAVQLTSSNEERPFSVLLIKALVGNAGLTYVGNDGAGDVTSSNGFELSPGDSVKLDFRNPITGEGREFTSNIWVDAATSGDVVCWWIIKGAR